MSSNTVNSDTLPAESRIGYGNGNGLLNSQLNNRRRFAYTNLGLGAGLNAGSAGSAGLTGYGNSAAGGVADNNAAATDPAQGVGYLDYFDSGSNINNGLGLDYGLTYNPRRFNGNFRRRNGLMNAGTVGAGGGGLAAGGLGAGLGGGLKSAASNGLMALASSGYGGGHSGYGSGHSGYGGPVSVVSGYGPSQQCESGLNPLVVLLTLAGAAIGFYFIYIKLTMSGGRTFGGTGGNLVDSVADIMWIGI